MEICLNNRFKSSRELFWSILDNILVLLCEGPKPNISMISGFFDLLLIAFICQWLVYWRTMGAAGWTRDGSLQDFEWFWGDFGTCVYELFEFKKLQTSFCFSGLFFKSFLYRFLNRNFDVWDLQIEVFAWNVLQQYFLWKPF